ncbi:uncharacterized protein [Ptychodera flava]|uniref:uncharacterized protein n=1 Tax=Ptychodera flava TaxID=63121 RepID=UPI00396AA4EA
MKQRNRKNCPRFHINLTIGVVLAAFLHGSALARFTYFGFGSKFQGRLMCERFGLQLVKDDSEEKHERIVQANKYINYLYYWIDATVSSDIEIVKTADGVELTYKPFADNYIPIANSCVSIRRKNWESRPCDNYGYPICENTSSAELVFFGKWNRAQAVELCQQFDLRLMQIRETADYYDALSFLSTSGEATCTFIDASFNTTSWEFKTNYESVLTHSPTRFDVKETEDGSCIMLCRDTGFGSLSCESKRHVLCEEMDDGNKNVTSNSSIVSNSTVPTKISERLNDIDLDILQLFEGNFTLNMTIHGAAGMLVFLAWKTIFRFTSNE